MNAAGRFQHVVFTGKTVPRRRVALTRPFFTSSSVGTFFSTQSFGTTFARRTPSRAIDVAGTGLGIQRTALLALGRTVSTACVALWTTPRFLASRAQTRCTVQSTTMGTHMVQWQHAFLTSHTTPEKRNRCFFWWHTSANTIVSYQSSTMLAILFFNATLFTIVSYPRSWTRASTGLFVQRPTIVAFVQWADSCAQHVQHKTGILARSFSLCVSVLSLGP